MVDVEVLSAISFKIYEMRKYLVLSLAISLIAIPIANTLVIQRDRNRNEMYGEAFWVFGFGVYDMTDTEVAEALGPPFTDGYHTLPSYLGNITYEYPVFGLIFFAIATWLYPGVGMMQHLWLNFLLVLVFNLNLVLIACLLKEKLYEVQWARFFFAGYFVYGLIMSAGGGKLEPIVDCLLLMALLLRQEKQYGKAMLTLGLSVQTKIYSAVAFPLLFISAPTSIIWFLISSLLTVIPFLFLGASFDSLISHFLNTSNYSEVIVNPMYPGLSWATPDLFSSNGGTYVWPPAIIPLIIYIGFMLYTLPQYLPELSELKKGTLMERLRKLIPLYVYLLPAILFVFRWVMPWYLFWMGGMIFFFDEDEHAVGYLKELTIVGFLYAFGSLLNAPYFLSGPIIDFSGHFPFGWWTLLGLAGMFAGSAAAFVLWRWTFNRREQRERDIRKAKARGEIVI
ncbi:hypothetical protein EU537_06750 [Candidatus Thorarchaeota archaeon]|nr:MAG: hypothetical protein EU537_06750 [Candidatus Thorarchaeota archaeon]